MQPIRTLRQKLLFILVFSFIAFNSLKSQDKARNAVYVGLASRGPIYAINFDRIIRQGEKLDYSISAGFSIVKNMVSFPLGFHFITGAGDHHADFGVSFIPAIDYNHHLIGSNKRQADKIIFINPGLGYRYQRKNTGLFFKAIAGPSIFLDPPSDDFWDMDPKLYGFGSLSLGVSF